MNHRRTLRGWLDGRKTFLWWEIAADKRRKSLWAQKKEKAE